MMHVKDETKAEYRSLLRSYRNEENSQSIPNRFPWHSQLAVEELANFAFTKQETAAKSGGRAVTVRISTGTCPVKVYGDQTFKFIEAFVRHGGNLQVIVLNASASISDNPMFSLRKIDSQRVQFRRPSVGLAADKVCHFLCVGDQAYRFEELHADFSQTPFSDFSPEVAATICFKDAKGAKALIDYFDAIWERCAPIT